MHQTPVTSHNSETYVATCITHLLTLTPHVGAANDMMASSVCVLLIIFQSALSYQHSSKNCFRLTKTEISSGNFDGYRQSDTKKGAYEIAASAATAMPCIILVKPFLDQNVGSVSRAMVRPTSSAYDVTSGVSANYNTSPKMENVINFSSTLD